MNDGLTVTDKEIFVAIRKHGNTVLSISEILNDIAISMPRRSLQRSLLRLVASGHLVKTGSGPGVRYTINIEQNNIIAEHSYGVDNLILSTQATKIKTYVSKALVNRKPIGYNRTFLDSYQPNVTYMLNEATRKHLLSFSGMQQENRIAGTYAQHILNRLLIDLSWNSSRLEGNTYSLLETEQLLFKGTADSSKNAFETQMILNHKAAIEFLIDGVNEIGFNRQTILNLHSLLSDNLLGNKAACGSLRLIPVAISKTVYQPLAIPQLLEELFDQILTKASEINDPFEQSFFVLVQFAYLQAFEDVNKRVSRLAANIPFIKNNLSPLSFVEVPEQAYTHGILGIYELNKVDLLRDVFVWSYERSAAKYAIIAHSIGEPDTFQLQYRTQIKELVATVVRDGMNQYNADKYVNNWTSQHITKADYARFVEAVDTELLDLHEGNFARFKLKLSEFNAWKQQWDYKNN